MIDEKKIEEAANFHRFELIASLHGSTLGTPMQCSEEVADAEIDLIENSFIAGAKWAINELLKDLWHPNSEEPRKGAKFLYQNHYNSRFYYYIRKIDDILETYPNWSSYVKHVRVIQWLYIDDLLPKKENETEIIKH